MLSFNEMVCAAICATYLKTDDTPSSVSEICLSWSAGLNKDVTSQHIIWISFGTILTNLAQIDYELFIQ